MTKKDQLKKNKGGNEISTGSAEVVIAPIPLLENAGV